MRLLEERIRRDGTVKGTDVLKVDSFLNHQIDVALLSELGKEFHRLFAQAGVTRILTIEASGIAVACAAAANFGVPVVFAKKGRSRNLAAGVYTAQIASFTHHTTYDVVVSREFLHPDDRVLLIDDFLANGAALKGLMSLAEQAGAQVVGAGVCIEKAFQPGGNELRAAGLRVEALARIKTMSEKIGVEFC